jgi:hypothetical protein
MRTFGSREVPGERKPVIRDDNGDDMMIIIIMILTIRKFFSGGEAPRILNTDTRRRQVVRLTFRPL